MKTKIAWLIILLSTMSLSAYSQSDDEFYKGSNQQKGSKQEVSPNGKWVVSAGAVYGNRTVSLSTTNNVSVGDGDVNFKCRNISGLNVSIENKLVLIEAGYAGSDLLKMFAGKVYLGANFMPKKRFQILLHGGIGYSYNKIDDDLLEKKGIQSIDLGIKLRTRFFITNTFAIYLGGYGCLSLMEDKLVYDGQEYKSTGGSLANLEAGVAYSF